MTDMESKRTSKRGTYSAQQVADMLGVPLHRVKNFILVKGYSLRPTGSKSKFGRFAFADIFKFGLANALVNCGFEPPEVSAAIKAVPEKLWSGWAGDTYASGDPDAPAPFILIRHNNKWAVRNGDEVRRAMEHAVTVGGEPGGVFMLNLSAFFDYLFWERVNPYLYGGAKPELLTAETLAKRATHKSNPKGETK